MTRKRKLLVLDDEPDIGEFVRDVAIECEFEAISSHTSESFPSLYQHNIDVVVLDLMMPGTDGVEIIRYLAECGSNSAIILISGYHAGVLHSAQELASEHGLHVLGTLTKPIRYTELERLLLLVPPLTDKQPRGAQGLADIPSVVELQQAIERGEILPFYQPQLRIADRSLLGVEALVRWKHPQRGVLPAGLILDLALSSGLMGELTNSILNQALIQCRHWLDQGLRTQVSINVSADTLMDLELPKLLGKQLEDYALEPNQVVLEVTESALMRELVRSLEILTRLRMKGIGLSIDDFGTGYSSLVQLHRIPFSEMKIDRSFVKHALADEEALAIVKITIMLAHELGMRVVAEGIETAETWALLHSLGCDAAQGYHIARPMPGTDILDWLAQSGNAP
ncbi:MAG: EAL domain-containing response regulator [Gammaproteobacteria bacterium]|nr:EAL domain-containing response regulator [Gammaproteobacteria bacterium]